MSLGGRNSPLIGRGWRFPVGPTPHGDIAMAEGVDDLEQAIYLILATYPGERPMRPDFGTPLADFVFEPANGSTFGRLAHAIHESLHRWEPRIVVDDVHVSGHPTNTSEIMIEISYRPRDDYSRRSLVVPFYHIPAERTTT